MVCMHVCKLSCFIIAKAIPIKCFVSHCPPPRKVGSVSRIKKNNQKIIWVSYVFFKWYSEKRWVSWAMGNKTIYWDGLRVKVQWDMLNCLNVTKILFLTLISVGDF